MKDFKGLDGHIVLIDDPWLPEEQISDEDKKRYDDWFDAVFEKREIFSIKHNSDPTVEILK